MRSFFIDNYKATNEEPRSKICNAENLREEYQRILKWFEICFFLVHPVEISKSIKFVKFQDSENRRFSKFILIKVLMILLVQEFTNSRTNLIFNYNHERIFLIFIFTDNKKPIPACTNFPGGLNNPLGINSAAEFGNHPRPSRRVRGANNIVDICIFFLIDKVYL